LAQQVLPLGENNNRPWQWFCRILSYRNCILQEARENHLTQAA
jgi:hypothetical protein